MINELTAFLISIAAFLGFVFGLFVSDLYYSRKHRKLSRWLGTIENCQDDTSSGTKGEIKKVRSKLC